MIEIILTKHRFFLGGLFVSFALGMNQLRGVFNFAGIEAADGSSNYYFDFDFPAGFLGGTRTFPYPAFILIVRWLNIPLNLLPAIQFAILMIIIWLVFLEMSNFLPIFVLIPFLISASLGTYVPFSNFIGNEFLALSLFYSALLFLMKAHRTQNIYNVYISTVLFFFSILTRAAFIGPILFILVCYIIFSSNKTSKKHFLRNASATFGLLLLLLSGFSLGRFFLVDSFGVAQATGGLLAGHAALFDNKHMNSVKIFSESDGDKWVSEARNYLEEPCNSFGNSFNSWQNLKKNYDLHYQCYSELLMSTWVIAIHEFSGKLPLPDTEPFNKQVNAWKFSWPNSSLSLDLFFSKYYNMSIDRELSSYSKKILSDNFDNYFRYIISALFLGVFGWFSNLAFTNYFFDWTTLDSLIITTLFIIFYTLISRRSNTTNLKVSRLKLIFITLSPLILMFSILISVVLINVVHYRFHVIFTPLLILNISALTYLVSLGFKHNKISR